MTNYKLTGKSLDGHFLIAYEDGHLKTIELALNRPLTALQFDAFVIGLPYKEADLCELHSIGLQVELDATAPAATNEKIALFCRYYKQYIGIRYIVSKADSGKIKTVKLTDQILEHYFTSNNFLFKGKYSIGNLVKYWNELQADILSAGKPNYPNQWSKEYQSKLKPSDLPGYWQHLRSIGMKSVKLSNGDTIWK